MLTWYEIFVFCCCFNQNQTSVAVLNLWIMMIEHWCNFSLFECMVVVGMYVENFADLEYLDFEMTFIVIGLLKLHWHMAYIVHTFHINSIQDEVRTNLERWIQQKSRSQKMKFSSRFRYFQRNCAEQLFRSYRLSHMFTPLKI